MDNFNTVHLCEITNTSEHLPLDETDTTTLINLENQDWQQNRQMGNNLHCKYWYVANLGWISSDLSLEYQIKTFLGGGNLQNFCLIFLIIKLWRRYKEEVIEAALLAVSNSHETGICTVYRNRLHTLSAGVPGLSGAIPSYSSALFFI